MNLSKQFYLIACLMGFSTLSYAETTFGAYRLVPSEQAKAANDALNRQSKAATGQAATSEPSAANAVVKANSLVVNRYSGQNGQVSGQLLVLIEQGEDISTLLADLSLTLLKQQQQLVLLQADSNTDLLALRQQLLQHPAIKSVRVDVREQRYRTR